MDNTQSSVTPNSQAAPETGNSGANVNSRESFDARAEAASFFSNQEANEENPDVDFEVDPEDNEEDSSETNIDDEQSSDEDSQTSEKEEAPKPQDKKQQKNAETRIRGLVAENKEVKNKYFTAAKELDIAQEKIRLLLQENQVLQQQAQSGQRPDPRDEQIRLLEVKQQWQERQRELEEQHRKRLAEDEAEAVKAQQHEAIQAEKNQIINDIRSAAQEYFDEESGTYLISPYDIGLAMDQDDSLDAKTAAQMLARKREQAYAKRFKTPLAPKTAGGTTSGIRHQRDMEEYDDPRAMARNFFDAEDKRERGMPRTVKK